MPEPSRVRCRWFRRAQNYSGRAAAKLSRSMSGMTGVVISLRIPPIGLIQVQVQPEFRAVKFVRVDDFDPVAVPLGAMDPFGYEVPPGPHSLKLLRDDMTFVEVFTFEVVERGRTIVTIYPPTKSPRKSHLVRSSLTIVTELAK
jgi:hypothetical protein